MKHLLLILPLLLAGCADSPTDPEPSVVEQYDVPLFMVRLDVETTEEWVKAEFPDYECDRYPGVTGDGRALWKCSQAYGRIVVQVVTPDAASSP